MLTEHVQFIEGHQVGVQSGVFGRSEASDEESGNGLQVKVLMIMIKKSENGVGPLYVTTFSSLIKLYF